MYPVCPLISYIPPSPITLFIISIKSSSNLSFLSQLSRKKVGMLSFPSNIPNLLRRLRAQKLWLLAQHMAGVEEDVSRQIESIDEQIGQIEERARLFEKFWKIECEEAKDLDCGLSSISDEVAKTNHFEQVTSDQTTQEVIHNKIKQEHKKVSLVVIPTRSATPSRIPTLSRINSDSLAATPTRNATPSRISALPKTTSNKLSSLSASLATCKISKIPTVSKPKIAADSNQEKNIDPPSRLPESRLFISAHNSGSKIGKAKHF